MYKIHKISSDIESPIKDLKGRFELKNIPLNKFTLLGNADGGKFHIIHMHSPYYEGLCALHKGQKYTGYCASYLVINQSDLIVGQLFIVDPRKTHVTDSHLWVGNDSDKPFENIPSADDTEGVFVYVTDKNVLVISAEINDTKFIVGDD